MSRLLISEAAMGVMGLIGSMIAPRPKRAMEEIEAVCLFGMSCGLMVLVGGIGIDSGLLIGAGGGFTLLNSVLLGWLMRAERDDEDEDDGEGGGGPKRPIDWDRFDRMRKGWDRPGGGGAEQRDEELIEA